MFGYIATNEEFNEFLAIDELVVFVDAMPTIFETKEEVERWLSISDIKSLKVVKVEIKKVEE